MLNPDILSEALIELVRATVSNNFATLASVLGSKNSITKDAQSAAFVFPVIGSDDIPRDVMTQMAKLYETKLAWDIKVILERDITDHSDVSFVNILKRLPHGNALLFSNIDDIESQGGDLDLENLFSPTLESMVADQMKEGYKFINIESVNVDVIEGYAPGLSATPEEVYENLMEGKLTSKERKALPTEKFGLPELKKFPLSDANHVKSAMSYFWKAPEKLKPELANNILKAAKTFDVKINPKDKWYSYVKDKGAVLEAPVAPLIEPDRNPIPTYINVAIKYRTKDQIKDVVFTFEVKCIPHLVGYRELYTRLADSNFNFTQRWVKFKKDEEFKFVKDLMLDMDSLKSKAKYDVRQSPVFRPIEIQKAIKGIGIRSYPFVCYVLSENMVDEMAQKDSKDLRLPKEAKELLDSSLGMSLAIYRGSGVDIIYDSSRNYEIYTIADVVKESSRVAKDLRETISYYKRSSF
jgi:hypothetical protein